MWILALLPLAAATGDTALTVVFASGGRTIEQPAIVRVQSANGDTVPDGTLLDNGVLPDERAADGMYSGAVWFDGDSAQISVLAGGAEWSAGNVSFAGLEGPRFVRLSLSGDSLSATVGKSGGQAGQSGRGGKAEQGAGSGRTGKSDQSGGQGKGSKASKSGKSSGSSATAGKSSGKQSGKSGKSSGKSGKSGKASSGNSTDQVPTLPEAGEGKGARKGPGRKPGPLVMAIAALAIALAGAAAGYWYGRRKGVAPVTPLHFEPEPGIAGPGTPSLSEGLSDWSAADDDLPVLESDLLQVIAARHRVVAVCPVDHALPAVAGGPIMRTDSTSPAEVRQMVARLSNGGANRVALFVTGIAAAHVRAIGAELPAGVGGVVLCKADQPIGARPAVRCSRADNGWRLKVGERDVPGVHLGSGATALAS